MAEAKFEIYTDDGGEHRWRLKAGNGEIVAASESYTTRSSARRAVDNVKDLAPSADVEEV